MLLRLGVWVGSLLFPILCLWTIAVKAPAIEARIADSARRALNQDRFSWITLAADGRTLRLSGQVSSEEDKKQAERLVAAVKGVSRVDNRLEMLRSAVIQKQIDQILTRKLEFEPGETALAADSMPAMEELRAVLARAAVFSIRVDSFTDNAGPADKNRVLSQLRAQEVVNWLAGHGIARERMQATGHGPDRAIASNDSAEGRARNRRIEITVNER